MGQRLMWWCGRKRGHARGSSLAVEVSVRDDRRGFSDLIGAVSGGDGSDYTGVSQYGTGTFQYGSEIF
jgi:hypothetical protein